MKRRWVEFTQEFGGSQSRRYTRNEFFNSLRNL